MSSENPAVPTLRGRAVTLRPPRPGETRSLARSIARDPETSPWWTADEVRILGWLEDPASHLFVIETDGGAAGVITYEEEDDPDYRFAGIDISLLGPWIGRGLGFDSLHTLATYLIEVRGHHRIHIDPAAVNTRAIRAYARVGFKPVGVMRRYERGPDGVWRDALLMDLLAEELADYPSESSSSSLNLPG